MQLGGQTPLKLARGLEEFGAPVLGTSVDAIDRAEDRDRFDEVCREVGARTPENGIARSEAEALDIAERIGYPVLVRPSYVLGGRAMRIVYDAPSLEQYFEEAVRASPDHPVLDRPVPGGRVRGRRRRALGRDGRGHRWDHAAHRGRRGPLR